MPLWRKAQLLAHAVARSARPPRAVLAAPTLPETRFLVDAVEKTRHWPGAAVAEAACNGRHYLGHRLVRGSRARSRDQHAPLSKASV